MEIKPVILTPKQINRLQELENLVKKFKKILGLENEKINLGISGKSSAFLHWHKDKKAWGIYLLPSDNRFTPIHELGHIFLSKKTKYHYFAGSGIKLNKINDGIFRILNHLIDYFVDYNLIQFRDLYDLYIDDAHLWKHAKKKGKIKGKPISLVHSFYP